MENLLPPSAQQTLLNALQETTINYLHFMRHLINKMLLVNALIVLKKCCVVF